MSSSPPTPTSDRPRTKAHYDATVLDELRGARKIVELGQTNPDLKVADISDRLLYRTLNIPQSTGRHLMKRLYRTPKPHGKDTRGRKHKINDTQRRAILGIIEGDPDARSLTPSQLAASIGIDDVSSHTIQRLLRSMGYKKCMTCGEPLLSDDQREGRIFMANWILSKGTSYLERVLFSDVVHFGIDLNGKLRVLHGSDQTHHSECLTEAPKQKSKRSRLIEYHCWAMVGWNYKSKLHFWKSPTGMLNGQIYKEILQRMVLPTIKEQPIRVFEIERDSAHFTEETQTLLRANNVEYFLNPPKSPDFSVVQHVISGLSSNFEMKSWAGSSSTTATEEAEQEALVKQAVVEAWNDITQDSINKEVARLPSTLEDLVKLFEPDPDPDPAAVITTDD